MHPTQHWQLITDERPSIAGTVVPPSTIILVDSVITCCERTTRSQQKRTASTTVNRNNDSELYCSHMDENADIVNGPLYDCVAEIRTVRFCAAATGISRPDGSRSLTYSGNSIPTPFAAICDALTPNASASASRTRSARS